MKLKIKELREEMHYTQNDIANKIGSSARNVCNWENGVTEPDCETLIKLADVFFVSVDELLGRESGFGYKATDDSSSAATMRAVAKLSDDQKVALSAFLSTISK